jgi:O-antigen/teichoic acid export membrane protein
VYGLGIVLPRLLNYLLLTPFYTRVFERATYGIITELYAYIVFLQVVLTYGLETGYFRFASGADRKEKVYTSLMASLLVTTLLFITGVMLFGDSLGSWIGYASNPEYIRWLAVIVGIDAFTSLPFARIRLQNRPGKYAAIRIIEVGVNIGLNLFFLYYCPRHSASGLVSLFYREEIGVGYVLISNLVASLAKLILLSKDILAAFRSQIDWVILKKVLRYSYPLLVAGLAGTVNEALDRVLLKHLIPDELMPMEQLGIYGANFKMAVLMTLFVQMFKYAAEPFFFTKSTEKNAKELYADVMTFFVVAGLVIFLGVILFLDTFILFIGINFREGAGIVPVVLAANLIMGIFFNLSIWYKLTNKTMIGAVLVIMGAAVTVTVNVAFIPRYGFVASAWAHLLCYTLMTVVSYFWSKRHYDVPYKISRILTYMALALLLYLINRLFLQDVERFRNLWGFTMLAGFVVFVWGRERETFYKYRKVS